MRPLLGQVGSDVNFRTRFANLVYYTTATFIVTVIYHCLIFFFSLFRLFFSFLLFVFGVFFVQTKIISVARIQITTNLTNEQT